MFFVLSKVISWIIMPTSLIVLCMAGSLFIKNAWLKKWLFRLGVFFLIFFTNPFFAKLAMNLWEPDPIEYARINKRYGWAVVLAGITNPNRLPLDRTHFNKGADRLTHAIDLYKLKKINKLIISGGSGVLSFEGKPESLALKEFAMSAGVRARDIVIDTLSRNTWENAKNTRRILVEKGAQDEVLVITSAFHMRRAAGCFEHLGVHHDTFPTDYYGGPFRFTPDELIIPNLYALQLWTILIKEWVGILAYKVAGYN